MQLIRIGTSWIGPLARKQSSGGFAIDHIVGCSFSGGWGIRSLQRDGQFRVGLMRKEVLKTNSIAIIVHEVSETLPLPYV